MGICPSNSMQNPTAQAGRRYSSFFDDIRRSTMINPAGRSAISALPADTRVLDFLNTKSTPQLFDLIDVFNGLGGLYLQKQLSAQRQSALQMNEALANQNAVSIFDNNSTNLASSSSNNINPDSSIRFLSDFKIPIRISAALELYKEIINRAIIKLKLGQNIKNSQENYSIIKQTTFEYTDENSISECPLFQLETEQDSQAKSLILNQNGMLSLRRIMWMLKDAFPNLRYSPFVQHYVEFLLLFFTELQSFHIVKILLSDSQSVLELFSNPLTANAVHQNARKLKIHFTLQPPMFTQICGQFETRALKIIGKMEGERHFNTVLQYKISELFKDLLIGGFKQVLPLIAIFQVMIIFSIDGIRALLSVGLAIFSQHQKVILESRTKQALFTNLKTALESLQTTPKKLRDFFQLAYQLRSKQNKIDNAILRETLKEVQTTLNEKLYYRPKLKSSSFILKYSQFEQIWKWIPQHSRLSNPVLIFATKTSGYSLKQILLKASEHKNHSMLLIIKSQNKVFGCYCDKMIGVREIKTYHGSNETFVFKLDPVPVVYMSTGNNENHLLMENSNSFSIGSDSPALVIDSELKGQTFASETYGNPPLNGANPSVFEAASFVCSELEVYTLLS